MKARLKPGGLAIVTSPKTHVMLLGRIFTTIKDEGLVNFITPSGECYFLRAWMVSPPFQNVLGEKQWLIPEKHLTPINDDPDVTQERETYDPNTPTTQHSKPTRADRKRATTDATGQHS